MGIVSALSSTAQLWTSGTAGPHPSKRPPTCSTHGPRWSHSNLRLHSHGTAAPVILMAYIYMHTVHITSLFLTESHSHVACAHCSIVSVSMFVFLLLRNCAHWLTMSPAWCLAHRYPYYYRITHSYSHPHTPAGIHNADAHVHTCGNVVAYTHAHTHNHAC